VPSLAGELCTLHGAICFTQFHYPRFLAQFSAQFLEAV
jgi:hypothetical protein